MQIVNHKMMQNNKKKNISTENWLKTTLLLTKKYMFSLYCLTENYKHVYTLFSQKLSNLFTRNKNANERASVCKEYEIKNYKSKNSKLKKWLVIILYTKFVFNLKLTIA